MNANSVNGSACCHSIHFIKIVFEANELHGLKLNWAQTMSMWQWCIVNSDASIENLALELARKKHFFFFFTGHKMFLSKATGPILLPSSVTFHSWLQKQRIWELDSEWSWGREANNISAFLLCFNNPKNHFTRHVRNLYILSEISDKTILIFWQHPGSWERRWVLVLLYSSF